MIVGVIAALRRFVAAFNPATQFIPNLLGIWADPSDYTTLSQDSAGTTAVTAVTQPVGRMLDKSGRGNTLLQATAASRTLTATTGAVQYLTFDGVDDGLSTGAITLSADMDCFIAVRRNSAAQMILFGNGSPGIFGYLQAGGANPSAQGVGALATNFVNGIQVAGGTSTTGAQLDAALTVGAWYVLEIRNMNLSVWGALGLSVYSGYFVNGDIGGIILCPAGDATARQKNRQYLGAKVGLTLP